MGMVGLRERLVLVSRFTEKMVADGDNESVCMQSAMSGRS